MMRIGSKTEKERKFKGDGGKRKKIKHVQEGERLISSFVPNTNIKKSFAL